MNFLQNITIRKKAKMPVITLNESKTSTCTSTFSDASSLPDLSEDVASSNEHDKISDLNYQINRLTIELNSALQKIETLSQENQKLKDINKELQKSDNTSPIQQTPKNTLQCNSDRAKEAQTPEEDALKSPKPAPVQNHESYKKFNRKICIISENKHNNILTIAERKFENSELCHYLTPNGGLNTIISNLAPKLKTFTMNDYCMILIGETDFLATQDYSKLISYVRECLKTIQQTNVILCMPTYKIGLNYYTLFNRRVEQFINLLCRDVVTHEYAYIFDSNKNITWDSAMYRLHKGTLNNYGMQVIFDDIVTYINYIQECTYVNFEYGETNNITQNEAPEQLFLL